MVGMPSHDFKKQALALHKKLKGKIRITASARIRTQKDLSLMYTPGVGAVSSHVAACPEDARLYTMQGGMVAVISDGSAVLGLGNIGPRGALPVMEGKAAIFKEFAGVDAFPLVLDTQDPDAIIATIKAVAPGFAGINLEDIAAPNCFYIENRLKKELSIPVMHDDQHGTAIVVLAGLINAAKVAGKKLSALKVVISGAGAAGAATAKLLAQAGITDIIVCDRKGALVRTRTDLNAHKKELALLNIRAVSGTLSEVLAGVDVVIGVSGPSIMTSTDIARMAEKPIVFALANPVPEIDPNEARKGGAYIVATGRSDFPNQINNALVFPGIFRGALDAKVTAITDAMKLQAAKNLAACVARPTTSRIIPNMFDKKVVPAVARAVRRYA
jgi:malate dehydrogenase (oxaloacetate-decarboxylating)